jgi:hypothetical protein
MPSVRRVDKTIPLVDGLRLTEQLEDAGSGEVWRARITGGLAGVRGDRLPGELSGVGECVLRLLRLPVDEALRGRARALAEDLVALDDPGLVGIRSVAGAYDGIALIFAPLPSPVLPLHLLARRRQLGAGEVVTLGVALAWALAAAHRIGVSHGRLRDADVLLDAGGRPLLTGVGVMGVLGAPGTPEGDVAALGRLLASLLDASSDGADRVITVLADRSLTATELAARLAAATAAAPIELSGPEAGEPPIPDFERERRRPLNGLQLRLFRPPRGVVLTLGAMAVVALAGLIGWVSVSGPGEATTRVPSESRPPASAAADWTQTLNGLDQARAALFGRPTSAGLEAVDAPASSAYVYDEKAVAALMRRGAHAVGLRMVLERVAVTARGDRSVTLTVTDRRLAYEVHDAAGLLIFRVAERGTARHRIELRNVRASSQRTDRWRIASATEAS